MFQFWEATGVGGNYKPLSAVSKVSQTQLQIGTAG